MDTNELIFLSQKLIIPIDVSLLCIQCRSLTTRGHKIYNYVAETNVTKEIKIPTQKSNFESNNGAGNTLGKKSYYQPRRENTSCQKKSKSPSLCCDPRLSWYRARRHLTAARGECAESLCRKFRNIQPRFLTDSSYVYVHSKPNDGFLTNAGFTLWSIIRCTWNVAKLPTEYYYVTVIHATRRTYISTYVSRV